MLLPIENTALQFQTNMSGMINMNWLMSFVSDIFKDFNIEFNEKNFLDKIESWIKKTEPQKLIYEILQDNVNKNKLKNVKVFNVGVGKKEEVLELNEIDYSKVGNFGGVSFKYESSSFTKNIKDKK